MPAQIGKIGILILLVFGFCFPVGNAKADGEAVLIVGKDTTVESIDKGRLTRIYRMQSRKWQGGQRIFPVNLPATHPLRRVYSKYIFGQLPIDMARYWNERYFQGVSPPHVLTSEEAVVEFVATTPGAIGYISRCHADKRVRVIYSFSSTELKSDGACP